MSKTLEVSSREVSSKEPRRELKEKYSWGKLKAFDKALKRAQKKHP